MEADVWPKGRDGGSDHTSSIGGSRFPNCLDRLTSLVELLFCDAGRTRKDVAPNPRILRDSFRKEGELKLKETALRGRMVKLYDNLRLSRSP